MVALRVNICISAAAAGTGRQAALEGKSYFPGG
jgi:hypothetical protein